ncbi:hypothetical protein E2C01_095161 [Portunus trituberculatus]|uniref:Uncharacterized protein n=1 Tax=Portunus trituberculatus TaxID=210409 RepID=A0A5B7JSE5_PORTR|nr:hypothetical protein [Portunus trituberculatus]
MAGDFAARLGNSCCVASTTSTHIMYMKTRMCTPTNSHVQVYGYRVMIYKLLEIFKCGLV